MDMILEVVGEFIWAIIAVPLAWILATPFILVMSFFGKNTYFKNLTTYYKRIKDYFWKGENKK